VAEDELAEKSAAGSGGHDRVPFDLVALERR